MKTGIVILNYNNAADTIACLRSLYATTAADKVRVIVVDNGSREEVVKELEEFITAFVPSVTLLPLPKNLGYACGNNEGCKLLYDDPEVDYIAILNNDTIVLEDFVTPLRAKIESLPDVALISPLLLRSDGRTIEQNCARRAPKLSEIFTHWALLHRNIFGILSRIDHRSSMLPSKAAGQTIPVELISGSCFMVRKSLFESLNGFDSGTFLYYEENILWEKIRHRNLKNYLDCSVRLIHLGAATTSTQVKSIFVAKCLVESTRYFIRRFTDAGMLFRVAIAPFYGLFLLKIRLKSLIKR